MVGGWVGTEDRGDYLGSYRPELQLRITGRTEVLLLGGGLREWAGLGFVGNSSSSRGPSGGLRGLNKSHSPLFLGSWDLSLSRSTRE